MRWPWQRSGTIAVVFRMIWIIWAGPYAKGGRIHVLVHIWMSHVSCGGSHVTCVLKSMNSLNWPLTYWLSCVCVFVCLCLHVMCLQTHEIIELALNISILMRGRMYVCVCVCVSVCVCVPPTYIQIKKINELPLKKQATNTHFDMEGVLSFICVCVCVCPRYVQIQKISELALKIQNSNTHYNNRI